ncbi:diphosphomevalonate decarboxylase [Arapaima gigas]
MPEKTARDITFVTCTAPVNIAVIKYWGKRDNDLILPVNSSLSVTLHQDQLKSTTTVACSAHFKEDRIWLNGKEENINQPRLQSCLKEIRRLVRKRRSDGDTSTDVLSLSHKVHICSENNFPTAAGLASSAAGYACLVYTLSRLLGVEGELSAIARQGSGTSCQLRTGNYLHHSGLSVFLFSCLRQVSAERKPVGSTAGMQTSVETSSLLKHRAQAVVSTRMDEMILAIRQRDFSTFGELTMRDSNQFHAICLDTYPPIFYLNDVSRRIISLVHRYNHHYRETRVAYTFDAGPNAVIYTLQQHVSEFVQVVTHFFPPETNGGEFLKGLPVGSVSLSDELTRAIGLEPLPKGISYIISTKSGPGPQTVEDTSLHLLGPDGLPKTST